jgi:MFS family permease
MKSRGIAQFLGLQRNLVLLLLAIVIIGAGEETWMRFLPKYLESLGASALIIGLFDSLKTFLGAVYAYPGGVLVDRWGHRRALVVFNAISILGYIVVLLIPTWGAVIAGMFLFLAWTNLSLPATFSLVGSSLSSEKHTMGIGVQSLIKRLPIVMGPIIGGLLIDRYGVVPGVHTGLKISISLGILAILIQQRIEEKSAAPAQKRIRFRELIRSFDPPLRRLLFSDILIRFCERIPYAWVVIYAMDRVGVSAAQVGVLTAVEMMVAIACYVPVAHYADRYGREPFVIATFIFFTLFPLSLIVANNFALLAVSFAVRGLKEFGDPARKALIISYCRPQVRGQTIGAYYLIRDVIVSAGSFIGAGLWKLGPDVNFWSAAAFGLVGTLSYLMMFRRQAA